MNDSKDSKDSSKTAEGKTTMVETNAKEKRAESAQPSNRQNQGTSGGVAILFSIAALAGVAFTWYQTQVQSVQSDSALAVGVTEIGGQVSRLGDSISNLQREQSNVVSQEQLSGRFNELQNELDSSIRSFNEKHGELQQSIEKINSDLEKGVNAFVLDEVAQLLKLANHSLVFATDIESSINALTLADNQLKGLNDPRYTNVRTQINDEIVSLRSVEEIDLASLSSSLHGISNKIVSLPLINEPVAKEIQVDQPIAPENKTWRSELSIIWHEIKNSIQVQRVDQPPKPLLAPNQRYFLNQNLQLALNKAELAMLQKEQDIFDQSLQSATNWLQEYFDAKDPAVSTLLAELESLKNTVINPDYPSITQSYETLQTIRGGK